MSVEQVIDNLLKERDYSESKCGTLVWCIEEYFGEDFGEHSNMNDPTTNAIDFVSNLIRERKNVDASYALNIDGILYHLTDSPNTGAKEMDDVVERLEQWATEKANNANGNADIAEVVVKDIIQEYRGDKYSVNDLYGIWKDLKLTEGVS